MLNATQVGDSNQKSQKEERIETNEGGVTIKDEKERVRTKADPMAPALDELDNQSGRHPHLKILPSSWKTPFDSKQNLSMDLGNHHSLLMLLIWFGHVDFSFTTAGGFWHFFSQRPLRHLIISILDYCNLLLQGLLMLTIRSLQLIQNGATQLVFDLYWFFYITPLLCLLHWVPVDACSLKMRRLHSQN